jgi:hypothetical protein
VAAAGTAEEDRPLVTDRRAAAVGQDRWARGEACPIFLAPAGRGASVETYVLGDSAEDRGAAAASGIARRLAGEHPIQGIGKGGEVSERTHRVGAVRGFERVRKGGMGHFGHPWCEPGGASNENIPESDRLMDD